MFDSASASPLPGALPLSREADSTLTEQLAARFAERIRARLREKTYLGRDDQPFGLTATFGVVGLGPGMATAEDLFEAADAALFHAKSLGPDRVHVEG